tara:strand:- start:175 stop:2274 length:2100 start_codon:yes stop_codon:yes gene_type:complete
VANDNNNNDLLDSKLDVLNKQLETLKKVNQEAYDAVEKVHEQQKLYNEALALGSITQEEYNKQIEETNASLDEEGKKLKELLKRQDDLTKSTASYNKKLSVLNTTLSLLNSAQSKVISTTNDLTGVNLSHLNGLTAMTAAAGKYIREQDKLEVGLRRSTGYANRHTASFNKLKGSFLEAGLTSTDLANSISSLSNNFAAFDSGVANQTSLIKLSGKFKQLGMEGDQFAEVLDKMTFAYGFMGSKAEAGMNRLEEIANKTGRSVSRVGKDLIELGPDLARFGDQGIKVFEKLSMKARQLGLGVKQAFDVSELFDTFESAANVAGRLNAQLGLQLNSVKLMKANSDERLDILRQEFKLKGLDFKTSGRRQKQMIASILGVDVETAGRLLGNEMSAGKFRADKTSPKQRVALEERANALTEKSINKTTELVDAVIDLTGRMRGMQNIAGSDATTKMGAGSAVGLGIAGTALTVGGSVLARKFGLKGITQAMPKMLGNMFQKGGKVPKVTPRPTAGNRQQRRAQAALERRQGKPGSLARTSTPRLPAGSTAMGTSTKGLFGAGAKAGLKAFGRAIPFVGMGIGIMGAFDRIGRGDYTGAMGELGVGALSFIPGIGGLAAAVGGSIALSARDSAKSSREMNQRSMTTPGGTGTGSPNELIIKELVVHSVVELDGIQIGEAITKEFKKQAELIRNIVEKPLQPTQ